MRVFPPATTPHPWAGALAVVALQVATIAALYYLLVGLVWVFTLLPGSAWSFEQVTG